jgi:hypothetical protein
MEANRGAISRSVVRSMRLRLSGDLSPAIQHEFSSPEAGLGKIARGLAESSHIHKLVAVALGRYLRRSLRLGLCGHASQQCQSSEKNQRGSTCQSHGFHNSPPRRMFVPERPNADHSLFDMPSSQPMTTTKVTAHAIHDFSFRQIIPHRIR